MSAPCGVRSLVPTGHRALLLLQCPVLSLQDAVKGLFVCCVFLDYVSLSRRLVPELMNFLAGILYIAAPNSQSPGESIGGSCPELLHFRVF